MPEAYQFKGGLSLTTLNDDTALLGNSWLSLGAADLFIGTIWVTLAGDNLTFVFGSCLHASIGYAKGPTPKTPWGLDPGGPLWLPEQVTPFSKDLQFKGLWILSWISIGSLSPNWN